MSISKRFISDPTNIAMVVEAYRSPTEKPTMDALAKRFGATYQSIQHIISTSLSPEEFRLEKFLRRSRAKSGKNHPLFGKTGPAHPNWKGDVSDNKGRTTRKVGNRRYFTARVVMAEALGMHPKDLPLTLQVHHIDGNPLNNDIDNLALVSSKAHGTLHGLAAQYRKTPGWVKWLTAQSKEPIPIPKAA